MRGWMRNLLWDGFPILILFFIMGSISAVNWEYESKLFHPDTGGPDWTSDHLGPIMLAIAIGHALIASSLFCIVRIFRPKRNTGWFMLICMTLISIFLIFPSLFIVILGPAGVTMIEQMRTAPR